jgi:hypothetical protein
MNFERGVRRITVLLFGCIVLYFGVLALFTKNIWSDYVSAGLALSTLIWILYLIINLYPVWYALILKLKNWILEGFEIQTKPVIYPSFVFKKVKIGVFMVIGLILTIIIYAFLYDNIYVKKINSRRTLTTEEFNSILDEAEKKYRKNTTQTTWQEDLNNLPSNSNSSKSAP